MESGIDIDFDKQKTIFLEVNSRPFLKMHEYPRY
jgi:glutathione synthase/RimK-type ligase-like ATP-grasp enzyme